MRDQLQRDRAMGEAERSFIVEASAGTGKTSTLISRIVRLVLERGPSGPPLRLSQICAITFTEKAAGEMKIRLRQHFEQIAGQAAERARAALRELESASISTFHSFAVSLLKERPIEAGLDPHFTALDEIRSELFFREVWEPWISRALAERNPVLEKALRNGISLSVLQDLARTLRLNAATVRVLSSEPPPPAEEIRRQMDAMLKQGREYLAQVKNPGDRLLEHLERALEWLKNPAPECVKPSKPGKAGSAANWYSGPEGLEQVRLFVREVAELCDAWQRLPGQRLLHEIIGLIRDDFITEWEKRKRAAGFLDFDDQLWLARDLLIRSKAVRREFQSRYATLLVDEFQDTDPVQWDIVRLLSSTDLETSDPSALVPGPGRLFLVGDPKQSIYRFRGADIETYLGIADPANMQALGLERLRLTTNFRSVPSILKFVDRAFAEVMAAPADGRYQPDYLEFGEQGSRCSEAAPPSVHLLGERNGGSDSERTVREFLEREAARIAVLIGRICSGAAEWTVEDAGKRRTPRYGDIAILLPVLSRADILEDALREREIPYVLEGGKFYYARSEVSSAITILRAVANPNDSVALYGGLRSIFFGFSDEDLLRARKRGERLDYRARLPEDSPLFHPFAILRELHERRHDRPASETFEILLQKTGAREVLAARGFQSLANLGKLARTLRSLQGDATFSQVVGLLSTMDEEGLAESESRLMEERSNAVRIMSIHKSKGLDFPIVFVASLGLKRKARNKNLLVDYHRKKVFGLSIGRGLRTPGWNELSEEERKREDAELVRLLYVALTRPRDHLIISTHTQKWKPAGEGGQWIPETQGTRLKPLAQLLEDSLGGDSAWARWIDVETLDAPGKPRQQALLPQTRDWGAVIAREYETLRQLLRTPASGELKAAGQASRQRGNRAPEDRDSALSGDRSVRLGVAFHEAMETIDMARPENWRRHLGELAARYSLDRQCVGDFEAMMQATLSSDMFSRALGAVQSGARVLRELPFVRQRPDGTVVEGKIDLLFEEPRGWVLVDYKTDWVSGQAQEAAEHFRQRYSDQIGEYVEALRSLQIQVSAAYLLLARTGAAIPIYQ